MHMFRKLVLLLLAATSLLANGMAVPLDKAPDRSDDMAALQRGAKLFATYCMGCHSAASVSYGSLQSLGMTPAQIREEMPLGDGQLSDPMKSFIEAEDAKSMFGAVPADLSLIARARASTQGTGADWLYTYLRTYYQDEGRPSGWNNLVFPDVGMPHVLSELQGVQKARFEDKPDPQDATKTVRKFVGLEQVTPGSMTSIEYDNAVGDLVAYLQWMAEPQQLWRKRLGWWVLLFLGCFLFLTWRLNASYWKEVK